MPIAPTPSLPTARQIALAQLARTMFLTPGQAVALPVTVSCAAGKVGMTEEQFIARMQASSELRRCIADVVRSVMAEQVTE